MLSKKRRQATAKQPQNTSAKFIQPAHDKRLFFGEKMMGNARQFIVKIIVKNSEKKILRPTTKLNR